jgi:hypothetical protein
MPNIDAPQFDIIKFPQPEVIVATPQQVYTEILEPQTRYDKPRLYFAGTTTSGGAINLPEFANNIPAVIRENTLFAVAFWKALLESKLPLTLSNPYIADIRDTQMLSPHTMGKSAYPPSPTRRTPEDQRYGEYDFYAIWYGWILGVHPEMISHFSESMLAGVALHILKNHGLPRSTREKETFRIADNVTNYFYKHETNLQPIQAMISLPNPDLKKTQSLGTQTEQTVVKNIQIPSYNAVLHPEVAFEDKQFAPVWETRVGLWILQELVNKELPSNPFKQSVTFQLRDSVPNTV